MNHHFKTCSKILFRNNYHILSFFLFSTFYFLHSVLTASIDEEKLLKNLFADGVTIDLRSPIYTDGILSTGEGGIITGPNLRIQAQKITYVRKMINSEPVFTVDAEEDLIVEVGEYLFVGERLVYDFQNKTGTIFEGRSTIEPWFFGGKEIHILPDGSYVIQDGYFTTSENAKREWEISTGSASLKDERFLIAKDVRFKLGQYPLLWIPSLKADLDWIFDNPIRYTMRWGGRQGARVGVIYEFLAWNRHKAALRLDYRVNRGPGIGLETNYLSENHKESLETISYAAKDNSISNPHEKNRYRLQGVYNNLLIDDTLKINFTYDKLSDKDMATDYNDSSIVLKTAGRTALGIRRQEENWIANVAVRMRVNNFQTIKQELPTFLTTWRPIQLGNSGIIADNRVSISYLNFKYSKGLQFVHDYSSTRVELSNKLYRPLTFEPVTITPEVGTLGIFYGNSPDGEAKYLLVGLLKCDVRAQGYRFYKHVKHVIEPYANYEYYLYPTIPPDHHYIFDTSDGWYRLNALRIGFNQSLYGRSSQYGMMRYLYADLYAYSFFDTKTIPQSIPKIYSRIICNTTPTLRHTLETAWDIRNSQLGHINFLSEWTVNEDFAISTEYRHRDAYDWRKVDQNNFFLESFHSQQELVKTSLSDRRDTLLINLFYRFLPNWALQFESRYGWDRRSEPSYTEFELDVLGTLRSACNLQFSYQHRVNDDRLAVYFSLGLKQPTKFGETFVPKM